MVTFVRMRVRRLVPLVILFSFSADIGSTSTSTSSDGGGNEDATGYGMLLRASYQLENMTRSVRRSLKTMRKWYHSHPTEVRLGKCLAHYFNLKIPGLRRSEPPFPVYVDEDNIIKLDDWRSSKVLKGDDKVEIERKFGGDVLAISGMNRFGNLALMLEKYYQNLTDTFSRYQEAIVNNRLVICIWNYLVTKFWYWVDTAPTD